LRAAGADPEPLLFALAVAAAGERLLLSYPRSGGDGRTILPSHFFRAAAEALTGRRVGVEDIDSLPRELFTRVPTSRFGAATPADRPLPCHPRSGGAGRTFLPPHFFRAAAEALTGRRVGVGDIDSLPRELFTRVPTSRFGAATPEEALTAGEYDRTLLALLP